MWPSVKIICFHILRKLNMLGNLDIPDHLKQQIMAQLGIFSIYVGLLSVICNIAFFLNIVNRLTLQKINQWLLFRLQIFIEVSRDSGCNKTIEWLIRPKPMVTHPSFC
jgi:hypothetical protein